MSSAFVKIIIKKFLVAPKGHRHFAQILTRLHRYVQNILQNPRNKNKNRILKIIATNVVLG